MLLRRKRYSRISDVGFVIFSIDRLLVQNLTDERLFPVWRVHYRRVVCLVLLLMSKDTSACVWRRGNASIQRHYRLLRMASNDLTFWKNYQSAMAWAKGNVLEPPTGMVTHEPKTEEADSDPAEFIIDDDILDFYRHSQDHRISRSRSNDVWGARHVRLF